ncbi:Phosphopantetheine attachment site [Nitrosovibrio sp. Nv17]|nr:Phosphopantetheine attachment site [Nitrosovibrio sp. Nv17]
MGRQDNFFELGGDSILAMRITALLAQQHGYDLPVRHFFDHHTLQALASAIAAGNPPALQHREQRLAEMDRLMDEFEV